MSGLRLVPDPSDHQFKERDGVLPGTPGAPCRHCGEEAAHHIARQCAGGVSLLRTRCEADATYAVLLGWRRIPFCPKCAADTIEMAIALGASLALIPLAGGDA